MEVQKNLILPYNIKKPNRAYFFNQFDILLFCKKQQMKLVEIDF